jgi:hypothetical protein
MQDNHLPLITRSSNQAIMHNEWTTMEGFVASKQPSSDISARRLSHLSNQAVPMGS